MIQPLRLALGCATLAIAAGAALIAPSPACAGVFFGFSPVVIGPPVVAYPPPYYPYAPAYYPPLYAYPPAYAYAPPAPQPQMSRADAPYGSTCYAGVYTCRAPAQTTVGSGCSCPGLGAASYGSVQ